MDKLGDIWLHVIFMCNHDILQTFTCVSCRAGQYGMKVKFLSYRLHTCLL